MSNLRIKRGEKVHVHFSNGQEIVGTALNELLGFGHPDSLRVEVKGRSEPMVAYTAYDVIRKLDAPVGYKEEALFWLEEARHRNTPESRSGVAERAQSMAILALVSELEKANDLRRLELLIALFDAGASEIEDILFKVNHEPYGPIHKLQPGVARLLDINNDEKEA